MSVRTGSQDIIEAVPNALIEVGTGDSDKRFLTTNFIAKGALVTVRSNPPANCSGNTTIYMIFRLEKK